MFFQQILIFYFKSWGKNETKTKDLKVILFPGHEDSSIVFAIQMYSYSKNKKRKEIELTKARCK